MLVELRIRDFAIIDSLSLSLSGGFNVLSGETGAGKSIIVGALGLLLGERGHPEQVRTGSDRAVVEGTFDASDAPDLLAILREQGIDSDDGLLFLRREVLANGRGRAWVNGFSVNISTLATVGRQLTSIHGQHEAQSLLDAASQLEVLDRFAGSRTTALAVGRMFQRYSELSRLIATAETRRVELTRKSDYLRHIVNEIESAALTVGEDDRLDEEAGRLEHAEQLTALASASLELLNADGSGITGRLAKVRRNIDSLERIDAGAARLRESVESAELVVSELARDVSDYVGGLEIDPDRLARLNERRSAIFRVARKFGGSVASALDALQEAQEELSLLHSADSDIAGLAKERNDLGELLEANATELTTLRQAGAQRFSTEVSALLPSVGMPDARFGVVVEPVESIGFQGADTVQFLVELNRGHAARELTKVASGGELSRIMLAIKTVLAGLDQTPSLVFDEVDSGIGGEVALQVGDALRSLAKHHQVFVITHLPQIAARAHRHLIVRKLERGGAATAEVQLVEGRDREVEITRMLSGDSSSKSGIAHARELLRSAEARG